MVPDMHTNTTELEFLSYFDAANEFGVSHYALKRLATAGKLTRYRAARDARRILLDRRELEQVFSHAAMNEPRQP